MLPFGGTVFFRGVYKGCSEKQNDRSPPKGLRSEAVKKPCHSEPVRTHLRAKSRPSGGCAPKRACGRSGVGIPRIFKHFHSISSRLTQKQLADATGLTSASISRYENGKHYISVDIAKRLAAASQISIGGKWYDRIPCGDEMDFDPCMSEGERCHDCGAKRGHYHHWNCDAERCPACHGQLLSCDCVDVYVENKHI